MEVSVGVIGGTSMVNEVEFWNGASYDEVVLRDRWIDARTYPTIIPPITPQGLYQTYYLELRQRGVRPVQIGIVQLIKRDEDDEFHRFRIESSFKSCHLAFSLDNFNDEHLTERYAEWPITTWEGWEIELPIKVVDLSQTLIAFYDVSPRKIADIDFPELVRQLNTQKCRALSMAFHPRLGAAAAIRMLDDALIDKIFEYCDDMHPYELRP